jgi:hypothetical protein
VCVYVSVCGVVVIVWVMGAWDGTERDGMPSPTLSEREWAGGSGGGCTAAQYWSVAAKADR